MAVNPSKPSLRSSWSFQRKSSPLETSMKSGSPELRNSWQHSLSSAGTIQGTRWKKFGTVSSAASDGAQSRAENLITTVPSAEKQLQSLEEQGWEISLAEKRTGGKRPKNMSHHLTTLYVTTPTSSMTLVRTYQQLSTFDSALQSNYDIPFVSPIPLLYGTGSPSSSPPRKRRSPLMATLSRTLSPSKSRQMSSLLQAQVESIQDEHAVSATQDYLLTPPLSQLSAYLSKLAKVTAIREGKEWIKFFSLKHAEDSKSDRVERRVKKMRSDPVTTHSVDKGAKNASRSDAELQRTMTVTMEDGESELAEMAALSWQLAGDDEAKPVQPPEDVKSNADPDLKRNNSGISVDIVDENVKEDASPPEPSASQKEAARPISTESKARVVFPSTVIKLKATGRSTKISVSDFDILSVLGKGCAGKVMLVRYKPSSGLYAMKAIHKHHVLAHRELLHTLTEQSVLRTVAEQGTNPFVVKLHFSFHDQENLFLVLDFHPGADLATQLAKYGRFGRDRSRFYAAEITEGLEGLHLAGVIYRDLKPENILIGSDGHIVLTDFGLSKQFPRPRNSSGYRLSADGQGPLSQKPGWMAQTGRNLSSPPGGWETAERETCTTFCGTAEYLAPEVLLGEPYSYECDIWSLGTMLYEMLTGVTPFYADDHPTMYRQVLYDDLVFDEDKAMDADTRSLLRGLLQKDPSLRMTDARIKAHPYFSMIDWQYVCTKRYIPPYIPVLNPDDELDTSNFDETFLSMKPAIADPEEVVVEADDTESASNEPKSKKEPLAPFDEQGRDVFCGYSFRGGKDDSSIQESDADMDEAEEHGEDIDVGDEAGSIHHDSHQSPSGSVSTRPTSVEVSLGHLSKDISMASDLHSRHQSTGLESLVEDNPAQPPMNIETSVSSLPAPVEEDEWDVVESEGPGEEYEYIVRRGRRFRGPTFFSRGIADKYVLAVANAVLPSQRLKGNLNSRSRRSLNSRLSSRSSVEYGLTHESPSSLKPKALCRSTSEKSSLASPKPLRLRIRPAQSKTSLRQITSKNSSRVKTDIPENAMSRSTSNLEQISGESDNAQPAKNIMKRLNMSAMFLPSARLSPTP